MSFTIFDIIVLSILTASAMLGLYKGFIKVTIGFTAFILSLLLGYYLYPYTEDFLSKHLDNEIILMLLGGVISYILSLAICSFISSKLISFVQDIGGGIVDRFLGLVVGLIRGGVISLIIFAVVAIVTTKSYIGAHNLDQILKAASADKYPCWLTESMSSEYLDSAYKTVIEILPSDYLIEIALPPKDNDNSANLLEKAIIKKNAGGRNDPEINEDLDSELSDALP
jgi:uncharacterized membrane protein required for colicin V production